MQSEWKNPFVNLHLIKRKCAETTPFMFKGTEYLLMNVKEGDYSCFARGEMPSVGIHDDHFIIRNIDEDRTMSAPLYNCYFASAFVHEDRVYCFAIDYELDRPWWTSRRLIMVSSDDLVTWTKPIIVLEADENESLFNTDVVWDGKRFVMLYETDDPAYEPKFTFKFAESDDLIHWRKIPDAIYGIGKYVGGPCMEVIDDYYYVTYVNHFKAAVEGVENVDNYDTRITRSKDLIHWEDAPEGRSVVVPTYKHSDPKQPHLIETNASDIEFLEKDGRVYAYYMGGNQVCMSIGGSYAVEYDGTLKELFEYFFI